MREQQPKHELVSRVKLLSWAYMPSISADTHDALVHYFRKTTAPEKKETEVLVRNSEHVFCTVENAIGLVLKSFALAT